MACCIGLDVSDKSTHLCVVDEAGAIIWRGVCATDPETIAQTVARHGGDVARVVLETGALSAFLYHGLLERGVPATCICARHAKGVLSVRSNKSDRHDSEGLAQPPALAGSWRCTSRRAAPISIGHSCGCASRW